jgi:hypothetical protein
MSASAPTHEPRRPPTPPEPVPGLKGRAERVGLVAGMSLASVNVWTGSPLLALWLGSRVAAAGDSGGATMLAFAVVAVAMLAISLALIVLLGRMGAAYDRVSGRRPQIRRHTPWLRAMSGERAHEQGSEYELSMLERVLVVCVVLAVAAFEIWFFFFSTSPIDTRSGRG